MTLDPAAALAIFLMASVTIGLKLIGVFVMRAVPLTPFLERFFDHLPGTLLISLVVPMALSGGTAGILGTVLTVIIVAWRRAVLLGVGAAMALAVALRLMGF